MRIMVIRHRINCSVHIWDNDNRESVFPQNEIPALRQMLKKAAKSKGIPEEELDERRQFIHATG